MFKKKSLYETRRDQMYFFFNAVPIVVVYKPILYIDLKKSTFFVTFANKYLHREIHVSLPLYGTGPVLLVLVILLYPT